MLPHGQAWCEVATFRLADASAGVVNSALSGFFDPAAYRDQCKPSVAKADTRDLYDRHPVHHYDAPVELIGFARRERQWDEGIRRRARALLAPNDRIAAHRSVAALEAEAA